MVRNWRDDFGYRSYYEAVEIDQEQKRVTSVDLERLAGLMFPDAAPMTAYAIERLLRAYNAYDPESWYVSWREDYYGDNWDATITQVNDKIQEELDRGFLDLSESAQVERALELEFGFVLPALKGATWEQKTIPATAIDLSLNHSYRQLDTKVIAHYAHLQPRRKGPVAIVTPKQNSAGYHLVDGAHRVAAALRNDPAAEVLVLTHA